MKNKKIKKGNAIAIALLTIGFLTLVTVGASTVILSSSKASKNVERNNNAFLAAESGIENALYEISDHSAGFEAVNNGEDDDHTRVNLEEVSDSEAFWTASSRNSVNNAVNENSDEIFIPALVTADPDDEENWQAVNFGTNKVIKLYADNTSCTAESGKKCD